MGRRVGLLGPLGGSCRGGFGGLTGLLRAWWGYAWGLGAGGRGWGGVWGLPGAGRDEGWGGVLGSHGVLKGPSCRAVGLAKGMRGWRRVLEVSWGAEGSCAGGMTGAGVNAGFLGGLGALGASSSRAVGLAEAEHCEGVRGPCGSGEVDGPSGVFGGMRGRMQASWEGAFMLCEGKWKWRVGILGIPLGGVLPSCGKGLLMGGGGTGSFGPPGVSWELLLLGRGSWGGLWGPLCRAGVGRGAGPRAS